MKMKRPLAFACLFFVIVIRLFYMILPPEQVFYEDVFLDSIYVSGKVVSAEQSESLYGAQTTLVLEGVDVFETPSSEEAQFFHDGLICYLDGYIDVEISEYVWLKGSFEDFDIAMNKGEFDSKLYYDILDIGGVLTDVTLIWQSYATNLFVYRLDMMKKYFLDKVLQYFEAPYDGLMQTMLLGEKSALDAEIEALYKRNGLIHVLTISGLHISMIGMGIYKFLRKLKCNPYAAAVLGIAVILLYGQMIGMGTSTFRAICMFLFQMLAVLWRRTYDRLTGLMVAGMLLLLDQPLYVFYSGFIYSFASVLGIICITPMVEQGFLWLGKGKKTLLLGFAASLGVLVMTLPVQLYFFYEYPIYSILLNFLLLPCLPFIVGGGIVIMLLPANCSIVSHAIAWGCKLVLIVYERACSITDTLPGSHQVIGAPSDIRIVLYYSIVGLLVFCYWKIHTKYKLYLMGICVCTLIVLMFINPKGQKLGCTYLSVGQGDGAVLMIEGKAYIVDCGSTTESKIAEYTLIPYLKYSGIGHVEAVFLSHQDLDHINGITQWLEDYENYGVTMGTIVLPNLGEELLNEQFGELIELAMQYEIEVMSVMDGVSFSFADTKIVVHHPEEVLASHGDANENSMVLEVQYEEYSLLFTGDIGKVQELLLLEKLKSIDNRSYILKSAHHGSNTSNDETFITSIQPLEVIISYGEGNSYGHPSQETMQTLTYIEGNVWETALDGGITISFHTDGYEIEQYVNPRR
ncbi:MAG: DNA internalization-related competence protein ComEC/Rec2 [Lachnospiraceae bacterium]